MRLVSSFALATALVLGAAAATPVMAEKKKAEAEGPKIVYSDAEKKALLPLQTAVAAKDWEAAKLAIPAAQAAAQGPDAKNLLGGLLYKLGEGAKDTALQAQGLELMIGSGKVAAADLPRYYESQGILASNAKDYAKAETAFARMAELTPSDNNALINLARTKLLLKKNAEALPLLEKVIAAQEAAGQKPEELWYRYALQLNLDAKNNPRAVALSRQLLAAYPGAENWKTALQIYARSATIDRSMELDLLRLMRASKSFTQAGEYLDLAQQLDTAGLPGEAKSVLEEGVASGKLTASAPGYAELMRTIGPRSQGDRASLAGEESRAMSGASGSLALKLADAYAGYRDYPKAITLYRAALQKGGVDANLVNTRLGIALASSGDRAGAEAAFKAVTGPRAELANLWLAWLSRGA
jgi:tetratricopeptide (TPR) repeat protein